MKRLYRILLRIYPAGFREEYASELDRQFSDEYREADGRRERIRLGLRALADLAATAPAEIVRELRQDLRYAARIYRSRPVATALALATLALAIGATTGIFSVLNALLIRSLPFREPERLVELWRGPIGPMSGRNAVKAWRDGSQYLEDAAFYNAQPMNLGLENESFRVTVCETTANFLRMLGSEPELGRGFSDDEEIQGRNRVAVIGYALWQQAFGGDPRAVGSTIRLNGVSLTVVGVAPRNFDFPKKTAVWTPTAYGRLPSTYWMNQTVGRLKTGISFGQASARYQADIDRVNAGRPKPKGDDRDPPRLFRLQDRLAGPVRPASLVLMGMMAFVLLIACANLAHLLLSRATERRQELAIRWALGASRARLTRQLITEATVLTGLAAIAGLAVAQWTARLAGIAQPAQLASRQYTVLDWRVLAFALGLAAVTGIAFGVLPASLIGRMQPAQDWIRTQTGTRGSAASRLRVVLIALQAALTVTLAAGSFSMGRSFLKLVGIDLGYRTNRVITLSVSLPHTKDRTAPFCRQALERLRSVPGVESAGAASYLPLANSRIFEGTFFRLDPGEPKRSSSVMLVTPGYFRTMGTPVIEGREFSESDRRGEAPVVIVNEKFAQAYRNQRLIGRKLNLEPANVSATIVGVVRSHRFLGPESDPWEVIYRPMDQYEQWASTFVAKVRGNPEQYLAASRDAVQGTDRGIPVFDVKTLDQRLADALARPRFYTTAIVFLAGFALLVAAIGAYGAASHSVSQRTHEIGIRIAVGGLPGSVRGMVFRQSMTPVCVGVVAGLLGAAASGRYLQHLMASAEPNGIWMCASAAIAIAAATACAVWTGTSRVVRTDPTAALRVE
jgi:putative ABC transport system permease protein